MKEGSSADLFSAPSPFAAGPRWPPGVDLGWSPGSQPGDLVPRGACTVLPPEPDLWLLPHSLLLGVLDCCSADGVQGHPAAHHLLRKSLALDLVCVAM